MFRKNKKEICNNCVLYDREEGTCKVAVLHEGEKVNIPVEPGDTCFFEGEMLEEIKQIRWFVEDEQGNPTEEGKVKVEFPEELLDIFGDKK